MASSYLWTALLVACTVNICLSTCPFGWFGVGCRYKCQCKNNLCNEDGSCVPPSRCEFGWFGPACQYEDIAAGAYAIVNRFETSTVVTDGDDTTCFSGYGNFSQILLYLDDHYHFTWLRVRVKDPALLRSIDVKFRGRTTSIGRNTIPCSNKRTARVDDYTMDIHCYFTHPIIHLIVDGAAVDSLCSLQISGGRNVALKERTSQSTIYTDSAHTLNSFKPSNAVDGLRATNIWHFSCVHTLRNDPKPWWSVNFTRPYVVNRFVLYEREKAYPMLKGFHLSGRTSSGVNVFQHNDNSDYQVKYVVIPSSKVSLKEVKIQRLSDRVLGFCEAEIFGESICERGKYGRDCEHSCNCANHDACFVSTGGCPSGCASGYTGEDCQTPVTIGSTECQPGKYGKHCDKTCNCANNDSCLATTGGCFSGCAPGFTGFDCQERITKDSCTCLRGWNYFQGNCYNKIPLSVSWIDAVSYCKAIHTQLIYIESKEENDFVKFLTHRDNTWLGASDVYVKDSWLWVSNKQLVSNGFTDWNQNPPVGRKGARCLLLDAVKGYWIKNSCRSTYSFICKHRCN